MSLRSESKKFLYVDKVERELEMKEADSIPAPRRPLPRFQKDSGTNCVSAGLRERASHPGHGHRAWPLLPFFGVVLCMGILGIHLLPPSKYMNFADRFSSYDPDQKVLSLSLSLIFNSILSLFQTLALDFSPMQPIRV